MVCSTSNQSKLKYTVSLIHCAVFIINESKFLVHNYFNYIVCGLAVCKKNILDGLFFIEKRLK